MLPETPRCWSNHLGMWCIEPLWFTQAVALYRAGAWQPVWPEGRGLAQMPQMEAAERRPYALDGNGTALIPLEGPLSKTGSYKFGGSSTVLTQRMLRQAMHDESVQAIALVIDSPGGHVAGTQALADEVASIRGRKPIVAQIDDLGASAAYWVASQADAIYANSTAEIGSIGTVLAVEDSSGRMDRLGVKVHVLSTGAYKGIGIEGAPVSDAALEYLQARVNGINQHFLTAVQTGRRLSPEQVALVSDGRVHLAAQASALGLIDGIQSLETTLAQLASPGAGRDEKRRGRAARLAARAAVTLPPLEG